VKSRLGSLQSNKFDSERAKKCSSASEKQTFVGQISAKQAEFGEFQPQDSLKIRQIRHDFHIEMVSPFNAVLPSFDRDSKELFCWTDLSQKGK